MATQRRKERPFMQDTKDVDAGSDNAQPIGPITATDLRQASRDANRNVALVLLGVAAVFLAAAFGVGFLVLYGPY